MWTVSQIKNRKIKLRFAMQLHRDETQRICPFQVKRVEIFLCYGFSRVLSIGDVFLEIETDKEMYFVNA